MSIQELFVIVRSFLCALINSFMQLSASSAALDLALSQSPGPEAQADSRDLTARHRLSLQQNLQQAATANTSSQNGLVSLNAQKTTEPALNSRQSNRHSMEASLAAYSHAHAGSQSSVNEAARPSIANAHLSYSTNDVPTLKNSGGMTNVTPPRNSSQQFHNHNASLGRIPTHVANNRHSRELSSGNEAQREDQVNGYHPMNSALQTNLASPGPVSTISSPVESLPGPSSPFNSPMTFPNQPFYAGYGMQLMNAGMNPIMTNPIAFQNQMQVLQQQNGFLPYSSYAQQPRFQDGQARMMQQRRMQHGEGNSPI